MNNLNHSYNTKCITLRNRISVYPVDCKSYVIKLVVLFIAIHESFFSPDGHRNVIKLIIIIFELTYLFNYIS